MRNPPQYTQCTRCSAQRDSVVFMTCTQCRNKARAYSWSYRARQKNARPPYNLAPHIAGPAIARGGTWHPIFSAEVPHGTP